jgi:uncharacterized surface protein with fasciclin (FAS1) repeats
MSDLTLFRNAFHRYRYYLSLLTYIIMFPFYSVDVPGDIVCAGQNSVLSCTCRLLRESGLASLLDECRGRKTLFAPTNRAWNRLFGQCPTGGFGGNRLLEFFPNSRIVDADRAVVADESADGGRGLQQQQDNFGLRSIMGYHIVNKVIPFTQLSCGDDILMSRAGTSETRCRRNFPFAQQGTCNTEANLPNFTKTYSASNGEIYSVDNVLIPSPDGTLAGCTDIVNGQCSTNPRCNNRNNCENRDECSGDWLPNDTNNIINNGNSCCRRSNIINNDQCSSNARCDTRNNCNNRSECSGDWLPTGNNNINNSNDFCCRRNNIINNDQCSAIQRCSTNKNVCEDRNGCFGNWLPNGRNGYCANRQGNIQRPDPSPKCDTRFNCNNRIECSGIWVQNDNNDNNNNGDACCYRRFEFDQPFFGNCVCGNGQCVNQIRFKYTSKKCDKEETQNEDNRLPTFCRDFSANPPKRIPANPPRPTYKVYECGVTTFPELDVRGDQQLPEGDGTVFTLAFGIECLPKCITIEIRRKNTGKDPNEITQRFNINTGFNNNIINNCQNESNLLDVDQVYGAFETVNNDNAFNCRDF